MLHIKDLSDSKYENILETPPQCAMFLIWIISSAIFGPDQFPKILIQLIGTEIEQKSMKNLTEFERKMNKI